MASQPTEPVLPACFRRVVQLVVRLDLGSIVQMDVPQQAAGDRLGVPKVLGTAVQRPAHKAHAAIRHRRPPFLRADSNGVPWTPPLWPWSGQGEEREATDGRRARRNGPTRTTLTRANRTDL